MKVKSVASLIVTLLTSRDILETKTLSHRTNLT